MFDPREKLSLILDQIITSGQKNINSETNYAKSQEKLNSTLGQKTCAAAPTVNIYSLLFIYIHSGYTASQARGEVWKEIEGYNVEKDIDCKEMNYRECA